MTAAKRRLSGIGAGQTAILPSPKVERCLMPLIILHFCRPSWLMLEAVRPFLSLLATLLLKGERWGEWLSE